jgi:hypothetical protein
MAVGLHEANDPYTSLILPTSIGAENYTEKKQKRAN